jgi:uroporphyrinogen-III synthase
VTTAFPAQPLADRTVAIAETRELDVFASLLERRGARVLRYPLVQIVDAPDPALLLQFVETTIQGRLDDLILLTGEGLRRLLRCVDVHQPTSRQPFLEALSRLRKITRGPKPARALRELGLIADLPAAEPTTQGVITSLQALDLRDRRVGVQLYGDEPNRLLMDYLVQAGAAVTQVMPYRYAEGASAEAVAELLARMRAGEVDAIAFTSKAQVERLFRGADASEVRKALSATHVAVVGPVVREALAMHGVEINAMPQDAWFMKPLTSALSELLAQKSQPEE